MKILGMLPKERLKKTIVNTTHYYLSVDEENGKYPRGHYKYHFP